MLHYGLGFVALDTFRHHIIDVSYDGTSKLKVELTLNSLFGDGLSSSFGVTALELSGQKVAQPSF